MSPRERRTGLRIGLAGLLAGLVAASTTLVGGPAAAVDAEATTLENAVLRWGLSNEANNSAWAPGTQNFFSAGKVPNPGRGGTTLARGDWRQSAGNVAVEKSNGSSWKPATWAGLSTTADGSPLGIPTSGKFSDHQVVLSGGSGTVDRVAGTAKLEWTGDFTVLLYSGMSFFYVSDPVLEVAEGKGRLTATLSGYGSSQEDTSVWEPLPAQQVTLADLPGVELGDDGFTADAAYRGVTVSGVGQEAGGAAFGSFPQSFISYMNRVGTAAYWCSTGASTDAYKVALPVTVSFGPGAAAPVPTAPPAAPVVENAAPPAPAVAAGSASGASGATASSSVAGTSSAQLPPSSTPVLPAPVPVAGAEVLPPTAAAVAATSGPGAAVPLRLVATPPAGAGSGTGSAWWATGLGLLVVAGLVTLATLGRRPLFFLRTAQPRPRG